MFDCIGTLRHNPTGILLQAYFFQQKRKRHSCPFAATGEAMRFLYGRSPYFPERSRNARHRTIAMALEKVELGNRWQTPQFLDRKNQGSVNHAMDQKPVLTRINIRRIETVRDNEMKGSWRDYSDGVLQRRPKSVVARL
jgi:hypothetical protein